MTRPAPHVDEETPQEWADRMLRERGPVPVHIAQCVAEVHQQLLDAAVRRAA